jgi:twitching motility two-component system response regulator PilH
MANTTVFSRTEKGHAELKSTRGALGPQLRGLLNMVDGKSTVDQILAKLGRVDAAKLTEAFHLLAKDGYIAPAATAPAKATPAKPAPAPAAPAPGGPITLDFTAHVDRAPAIDDAPAAPPSAEQKQEAEVLTMAGMRTLKSAGYYVNILSKPGLLQPPRSGGKKYSVLILDDDQATTLVIARTLMVADFDVRSGETRDSALAELKKVPLPDAIVLNPHMRDLNGLDLLSRLQQHQFYCSVPVVIVTAELNHEDVVDALARGASGYMTKPFKPEALLDTVRAVLGLK